MTYHVTWCSLQIFSSYWVCILIPSITDSSSLGWLSRGGYSCCWYRGWSRRGTNWPHNRAIKKRVDILMLKCFVSSHNLKTTRLGLIQFSFKIHLRFSSSHAYHYLQLYDFSELGIVLYTMEIHTELNLATWSRMAGFSVIKIVKINFLNLVL